MGVGGVRMRGVLKWAGWWTGGGGGERGGVHCNHFCYWGKLHYHDLQCDSIYIAHNDLLAALPVEFCDFKPSGSSSEL